MQATRTRYNKGEIQTLKNTSSGICKNQKYNIQHLFINYSTIFMDSYYGIDCSQQWDTLVNKTSEGV